MAFKSDIVIGMEVHVELATKSKLFCSCPRTGSEEPNTRTCPVCLGHPGSKPVLNRRAVDFALRLALATGCKIADELLFSRKSYFYPDMAKNYQISQYEIPLAENGLIRLPSGKEVRLRRIHMEEDPAALVHPSGMAASKYALVDYNRSGNPLVEVVTEPDMESPDEAREFMRQLISILNYIGIFDVNTGIIKADANISIKASGYVRAEIKNITGFKEIERALIYEVARQKKEVSEGKTLKQETRACDAATGITRSLRTKETEEDYGYILDPDLPAVRLTKEWVDSVKLELPELAHEKTKRYIKELGLPEDDAAIISMELRMAELFEKVSKEISPKLAAKWLRRELARVMNYNNIEFSNLLIDETHLIELLGMVEKGEITENVAQKLLEKLVEKPFGVRAHVKEHGLATVSDKGELERWCKEAIAECPDAVKDYASGNEKALNFVIGKVMKKSRGTASPADVKKILEGMLKR
jgi:aspartyl-tRNA(Asn)/glutamyl-tRNA(Gln) amidotransferase subunit B